MRTLFSFVLLFLGAVLFSGSAIVPITQGESASVLTAEERGEPSMSPLTEDTSAPAPALPGSTDLEEEDDSDDDDAGHPPRLVATHVEVVWRAQPSLGTSRASKLHLAFDTEPAIRPPRA